MHLSGFLAVFGCFPGFGCTPYSGIFVSVIGLDCFTGNQVVFIELKRAFTGRFDYFFLDQYYSRQYKQDEAFGILMGGFTGLAIFVSCLGLWVLVMFSCTVRTKEMGIRKVLGASRWNLFYQLGKGFFIPVIVAIVIALPVAWFSMNAWLSHYAFRTDLEAWFFLLPVCLMLLISFLTVAGQTMKVIYSKPARSLRYE